MNGSKAKAGDSSVEEERNRQLRQGYRDMIEDVERNMEQYAQPGSLGIKETLEKASRLIDEVNRPREAVLDSQLLVAVSKIARKQAQNVNAEGNTFDADAFMNAVKTYMSTHSLDYSINSSQEAPLDWAKLGRRCRRCFQLVPAVNIMYGPANVEPPVKKQKDRSAKRQVLIPNSVERPKEIDPNATDEESTTKEVHRIHKILSHHCCKDGKTQPINFFKFALNPASFGRTVENLFHISFLIRDGRVKIFVENNVPMIVTVLKTDRNNNENCSKNQTIISLDHETWRELISSFKIDECLITPRN